MCSASVKCNHVRKLSRILALAEYPCNGRPGRDVEPAMTSFQSARSTASLKSSVVGACNSSKIFRHFKPKRTSVESGGAGSPGHRWLCSVKWTNDGRGLNERRCLNAAKAQDRSRRTKPCRAVVSARNPSRTSAGRYLRYCFRGHGTQGDAILLEARNALLSQPESLWKVAELCHLLMVQLAFIFTRLRHVGTLQRAVTMNDFLPKT